MAGQCVACQADPGGRQQDSRHPQAGTQPAAAGRSGPVDSAAPRGAGCPDTRTGRAGRSAAHTPSSGRASWAGRPARRRRKPARAGRNRPKQPSARHPSRFQTTKIQHGQEEQTVEVPQPRQRGQQPAGAVPHDLSVVHGGQIGVQRAQPEDWHDHVIAGDAREVEQWDAGGLIATGGEQAQTDQHGNSQQTNGGPNSRLPSA